MQRVLIADMSEVFTQALKQALCPEFEVRVCHDGISAQALLLSYRPDILILNFTLPYKDGLSVLQESGHIPPVILGITYYFSSYVVQTAQELGVGYILQTPSVRTVCLQLENMLQTRCGSAAAAEQTRQFLQTLGIPAHLDGYRYLLAGIPLFHQDPQQRLTKELYPAIAKLCDCGDIRSVERSIRTAIEHAWRHHDPDCWGRFFPSGRTGKIPCPSNKLFISCLAQMLP